MKFLRNKLKIFFSSTGSRYVELYFDSPRYASLNIQPKKRHDVPRRPSRSPSKPKNSRFSRSRSK